MLSKCNRVLVAAAVAAMLAACGGGDGGSDITVGGGGSGGTDGTVQPAAAAADKYVGTWQMACQADGNGGSENETLVVTKVSDTSVKADFDLRTFNNATCSGGAASTEAATATVTIDGQTTLTYNGAATTFDKLSLSNASAGGNALPNFKWTGAVVNGKLVIDFEDNNNESTTTYPANPNEGSSVYSK